jgi:hypothetical protein
MKGAAMENKNKFFGQWRVVFRMLAALSVFQAAPSCYKTASSDFDVDSDSSLVSDSDTVADSETEGTSEPELDTHTDIDADADTDADTDSDTDTEAAPVPPGCEGELLPDPGLKRAVREALEPVFILPAPTEASSPREAAAEDGLLNPDDSPLYFNDVKELTSLDASMHEILELTDIQCLVNFLSRNDYTCDDTVAEEDFSTLIKRGVMVFNDCGW